jgi:hypothetical protein
LIEVAALAIVEVMPPAPGGTETSGWSELDTRVRQDDYWEMLLPSQYARTTELLMKLGAQLDLERRGSPWNCCRN